VKDETKATAPSGPGQGARFNRMPLEERRQEASRMAHERWKGMTKEERSAAMAAISGYKPDHPGGRPRSKALRCPCGVMTLKRARARADREGRGLGHLKGCSFYRAKRRIALPKRVLQEGSGE